MINFNKFAQIAHKDKIHTHKYNYYIRLISLPLTYLLFTLKVKPNFVSLLTIIFCIFGSMIIILYNIYLGLIFFLFSTLLDKSDGDLARLTNNFNHKSEIIDFLYHRFSILMMSLSISLYVSKTDFLLLSFAFLLSIISSIIEELQLLAYRYFSHKIKDENVQIIKNNSYSSLKKINNYIKILKSFRHLPILTFYFLIYFILNEYFSIDKYDYIFLLPLFSLIIYFLFQIFFVYFFDFDQKLNSLKNRN